MPGSVAYPEPEVGCCVNHPDVAAQTLCDVCGDFLCPVCVLPVRAARETRHFCPACHEHWRAGRAILAEEARAAGGGAVLGFGVPGLLLALASLADATVNWVLAPVAVLLGLLCLGAAWRVRRAVDLGLVSEDGRRMARIGAVLSVLVVASASLAVLVVQWFKGGPGGGP